MNQKHKKRLITIIGILILLSIATCLILYALRQNINLFYTPTELLSAKITPEQTLRIGGYVKKNSVRYETTGQAVQFTVTDKTKDIRVIYQGVLPSLFREEQTVVVTGKMNSEKNIMATQVLAKHDEKYMPSVLKDKIKKQ